MSKYGFQIVVGFLWFFCQLGTIIHIFALQRQGGYLFEEFTTSVAIIAPMFLGFTSAFVGIVIESNKRKDEGEQVSLLFATFTLVTVTLFILALNWLIHDKAYSNTMSFEQFKLTLGVLQTILGVSVGALLGSLFGVAKAMPNATPMSDETARKTA